MAKRGRPTLYSKDLAEEICFRLADGHSLVSICQDVAMPDRKTVLRWLWADNEEFRDMYARAREAQADYKVHELSTIVRDRSRDTTLPNGRGGRTPDQTAVARDRLIADSIKWEAARLAPRVWGDKVQQEISGKDGAPIAPVINFFTKTE